MIKIPDNLFYSQEVINKYVKVIGDIIFNKYMKWRKVAIKNKTNTSIKEIFEGKSVKDKADHQVLKDNIKQILTDPEKVLYPKSYGKRINNKISKIINYDNINTRNKDAIKLFGESGIRHYLLSELGVDVCPYCNRQYITPYNEKNQNNKKTTADLDHYRPKSKYPLLALSLYNFIPSCQICNERMKGDNKLETINPYFEGFGNDCIFTLSIDNGVTSESKIEDELKLIKGELDFNKTILKFENLALDKQKHKRIENSLEVFKLEEVYQIHRKKAGELFLKRRLYANNDFMKSIKSVLNETIHSELTQEEFDLLIYGYKWNKDGENINEPLSKMIYDIVKR